MRLQKELQSITKNGSSSNKTPIVEMMEKSKVSLHSFTEAVS